MDDVRAIFPPTSILASAGSGKTYRLSTRYLAALQKSTPDRILATTFTRKAAGEIRNRLFYRLALAAENDRAAKELSRHIGQEPELFENVVGSFLRSDFQKKSSIDQINQV